jgi:acyl carrier protein
VCRAELRLAIGLWEESMENTPIEINEVVQQIKQILVEDLELNVVADEMPDECSLLDDGLAMDSILIAELIVRIEDRFGFQFDDRMLETKLFDNLSALAAFIARECLAAKSTGEGNQVGESTC